MEIQVVCFVEVHCKHVACAKTLVEGRTEGDEWQLLGRQPRARSVQHYDTGGRSRGGGGASPAVAAATGSLERDGHDGMQ